MIIVEHDEEAIREADFVVDIGPGAGINGGEIVASGSVSDIIEEPRSITGQFLSGSRKIDVPTKRHTFDQDKVLALTGAKGNNLNNINLILPIGLLTCITGVSGSGKSPLITQTLYPLAARELNGATNPQVAPYEDISGLEQLDKVVDIDQSPIGTS